MPDRPFIYLDVAAVLSIHQEVLSAHGGRNGMRDLTLLESAVAAPRATAGGQLLIDDPIEIGAAYLFYLCRNHPFIDGNKRTALASALVFLHFNEALPNLDVPASNVDAWEALVISVANDKVDRVFVTAELRKLIKSAKRK